MVYFSSTVKRSQGWLFFSSLLRKEEHCPLLTAQVLTLFEGLCPSGSALPCGPFYDRRDGGLGISSGTDWLEMDRTESNSQSLWG